MSDLQEMLDDAVRAVKIEFSAEEQMRLAEELEALNKWLQPLLAVDTGAVEPMRYGHSETNILREDEPGSGEPDRLRRATGNFVDGFYRVPSIIE